MKFLRSAVIFTFLILSIFTTLIYAQSEVRVSRTWEVQKYDITASLPQSETDRNVTIKAVLNVKNASGSPAWTLTLRISQNADVYAIKVNYKAVDLNKREENITST